MDVLTQLSILLLICFVIIFVPLLHRAKKRPNRYNCSNVAIFCLFIIGSIIGILGHIGWCMLIIIVGALLGIIHILLTIESSKAELVADVKKIDAAEPIRVKDFFVGWGLLLKLKRKYGTKKAMI